MYKPSRYCAFYTAINSQGMIVFKVLSKARRDAWLSANN